MAQQRSCPSTTDARDTHSHGGHSPWSRFSASSWSCQECLPHHVLCYALCAPFRRTDPVFRLSNIPAICNGIHEGSFPAACREFVMPAPVFSGANSSRYPESPTGFRVKHGMRVFPESVASIEELSLKNHGVSACLDRFPDFVAEPVELVGAAIGRAGGPRGHYWRVPGGCPC